MNLQNQLKDLYASHWDTLSNALQNIVNDKQAAQKPSYPFLLSITKWKDDKPYENWYTDADLKIMLFGQETNSWTGKIDDFPPSTVYNSEVGMEAVMGIYEDFYASHYADGKFKYNGKRYGTFHYGANKFISTLENAFPGKKTACVWNNLVKIGKAEGRGFCGECIYNIVRTHFSVIREEINILRPDLIVFLTGSYDQILTDTFDGCTLKALHPFEGREVSCVSIPGIDIPAYRTFHPSARLAKGCMETYYLNIINHFKNK